MRRTRAIGSVGALLLASLPGGSLGAVSAPAHQPPRFVPYGPVAVSGPAVSSAIGLPAPRGKKACGGAIPFGGNPYHVMTWVGLVGRSMSCRHGKAALLASVRWTHGELRLGPNDCRPVIVDRALRRSCRVRLAKPAGWRCGFGPVEPPLYWPVSCATRGASVTATWASPGIGTRIVWGASATGPPVAAPSLAVWTGEVDAVTIRREGDRRHLRRWFYELYPYVSRQYVVIGVARACATSAGATEAKMRSVRSDRLYFAQMSRSALGDKTRYIPLPPAGHYVVCDFFQRGPADRVALLAGESRVTVPDVTPREPRPAPA